eukprot:TRINITY_DN1484_c0_g2_i5.p1 TRINITY_DN1484_c0_g2~~TRINITY_DN1484_c0_g2_i5.p1  ORF type:complete len:236 (+),score=40.58 TRINITY_DN1484_c0_g2_i5:223-930(+)
MSQELVERVSNLEERVNADEASTLVVENDSHRLSKETNQLRRKLMQLHWEVSSLTKQNKVMERFLFKTMSKNQMEVIDEGYIYCFKDNEDRIIYIGQTQEYRERMNAHRNEFKNSQADKYVKLREMFDRFNDIKVETLEEVQGVAKYVLDDLEDELIKEHKPILNSHKIKRAHYCETCSKQCSNYFMHIKTASHIRQEAFNNGTLEILDGYAYCLETNQLLKIGGIVYKEQVCAF